MLSTELTDVLQEPAIEEIDEELIYAFEKRFGKKLINVLETYENMSREAAYVFDDGLGGYTIKGIIASLREDRFFN